MPSHCLRRLLNCVIAPRPAGATEIDNVASVAVRSGLVGRTLTESRQVGRLAAPSTCHAVTGAVSLAHRRPSHPAAGWRLLVGIMVVVGWGILLSGCSEPRRAVTPTTTFSLENAQVYATRAQSRITLPEFYRALREADYVLLGELHGDPTHHELQRRLLGEIVRHGRKPTAVFEMFNRRDAGLIATAIRQSRDPDSIAAAVGWDTSGWPDWRLYRPIVATALTAGLPIAAGNLSRSELRALAFGGGWEQLDQRWLQRYGLLQPLPASLESTLREKLLAAHGGGLPPQVLSGMLKAQRLRDASMAETMLAQNSGDGAVLITGREHARLDYGVPCYLRFREPDASIASVAFVDAADFDAATNASGTPTHDYLWLLPGSQGLRVAHE